MSDAEADAMMCKITQIRTLKAEDISRRDVKLTVEVFTTWRRLKNII